MQKQTIKGIVALLVASIVVIYWLHITRTTHHPVASIDGDTDASDESQKEYTAQITAALSAPKASYRVSSSTPQFVLLSFDGSKSMDMLDETLAFEEKLRSENKPLHFTYFINAAYFLTNKNANLYQPPHAPRGTSEIGFSASASDITLRVQKFNRALALGNEIGSHSVGHFNGSSWSNDEWKQEFDSFTSILANVQQNNPDIHVDAPLFLSHITGFRAPSLGVNSTLYQVMKEAGFVYDTSGVNANDLWPHKDTGGIWHIPLGTVLLGTNTRPVIAMDYSLWTRESNTTEMAKKGSPLWNQYYSELTKAYTQYFTTNYNGNRSPIVIADHFSKWNDGVYWEAMKNFAENVCGQPQVKCVTFSELVNYLNTTGVPEQL